MKANEVIAALVAGFDAATPTADVFDGPDTTSLQRSGFVLVGSTGEPDEDAVTVALSPSTLGPGGWLEEAGVVECCAVSWSGGTDLAARRASSFGLARQCIEWVQDDRTLGGVLVPPGRAEPSELRLEQRQLEQGALVRVTFSVSYRALVQ